ncbi:3-phosphoglycerate kinase [Trachipleistophora hominis]|uniref:Phosphoglycerate kinase n=1 Tax=Trachipleistophora hominis TaxID=72359 RepID=L7JWH2_TRAHO|nr:3-phosphoglycerate kinase [Trachipleistophora hominis]
MPMKLKDLYDVPLKHKKVVLYADFNVPIVEGEIADTFRIEKTLPTIIYVLSQEPDLLVIMTHLGRPDIHEKKCFVEGKGKLANTLLPVYTWLSQRINIEFVRDLDNLYEKKGTVLLENTRLYEKAYIINRLYFIDLVIFDGFGVAHRPLIIPKNKKVYAGLLMRAELERRLDNFDLVIMGGRKITDKMALIKHLKFKNIFFGGGMCFSILKQKKYR